MIELLLQAERALEMGRIEAAETLYRQVAEVDPRNSIAVVGLARVILERGDELGAYLEARRAMAIDPENAAAARMVQRLEEVMRFRGETVPDMPQPVDAVEAIVAEPTAAEPIAAKAPLPSPAPSVAPPGKRSFLARLLDRLRGRR
jgi:thioredoxin-like negative regulator of GroEL